MRLLPRFDVRLGVYADLVYRVEDGEISTDRAFIRFVTGLPPRVDEVVVLGRLQPGSGRSPYPLPRAGIRFVPLPYYPSVFDVPDVIRSVRRSCAVFASELDRLDAVLIFGPHPLALLFALIARRRRTPLALGIRQDYPQYIRQRLPGRSWAWAVPVARALDRSFRRLGRRAPVIAVGDELARRYGGPGPGVLATGLSLIRDSELSSLEAAQAKDWNGDLRLLAVGRLDPEKNPLLLVEILARLRARDPRWRLTAIGEGELRPHVERRARELGVAEALELTGYVPNGPGLWERYRASHAFLHVSFTEGLPQVLFEAQAAGLPIVATDVGGVGAAVGHGSSALLIPPGDAEAAARALERLAADEPLRSRLIAAGLENAARETMDAQLDRLAAFLKDRL